MTSDWHPMINQLRLVVSRITAREIVIDTAATQVAPTGKTYLLTDDYTLAILPLARLLVEDKGVGQCCASAGRHGAAYRRVLETGLLGYRLYTYHGLVRERFGSNVGQRVRERHISMLSHVEELGAALALIEGAVGIGTVTTSTPLGEIVTPVEQNVALALMLGLPGSPHYVTRPSQRAGQLLRMAPEIDWCFTDCLASGRREMNETFAALTTMPGISAPGKGGTGKLCSQGVSACSESGALHGLE